jgi:type I restriction enzyme S subunit
MEGKMNSRYSAYPAYKDSGVEWLGEIPRHWDVARIKYFAWFKYGESLSSDSRESGDIPVYGSNGQVGTHSWANTHAPCIIIGRKGSYGKINYSPSNCFAIDTTFFVDDSSTKCDIRWLYYCLSILGLDTYSQDSAVPGLSRDYAHNLWLPKIPLAEQRAIADYLNRETARVDALIAKYQRLIELLEEKRTSLIGQAVTKGLDSSLPMKGTNITWLGKVPAHWEIKKLKYVIDKAISGPFGSSITKDMYSSTGYRVYGQEQVIPDDFSIGDYFIQEEKYKEMEKYAVYPGDVLVSCVGTFGKVAVVPMNVVPGIINPRLIKLKTNQSKIIPCFCANTGTFYSITQTEGISTRF